MAALKADGLPGATPALLVDLFPDEPSDLDKLLASAPPDPAAVYTAPQGWGLLSLFFLLSRVSRPSSRAGRVSGTLPRRPMTFL